MKSLKKTSLKVLIAIITALMSTLAFGVEYQKTTFKTFFANQIAPIALSFEIPKAYVHAKKIEGGITEVYWMQPNEVEKVIETGDLPKATGSIRGQISMREAYSKQTGKFSSEDTFQADLKEANMTLLDSKRLVVNGYPVMAYLIKTKEGTIVGSIYVATMIDTNVLFFGYMPPNYDLKVGKEVWSHMISSLKKEPIEGVEK